MDARGTVITLTPRAPGKPRTLSGTAARLCFGLWIGPAMIGCVGDGDFHSNAKDAFGRTYYIDGAGNWGFGVGSVYSGLVKAGYKGNIINFRWSPTFNPALDQTIGRPAARLKGAELGQQITRYLERYPDVTVNIIALSAGTGVAVWACENVERPAEVYSVIMLGSSLSSDYDMTKALPHVTTGVFVYHSRHDMILQGPVRSLGTIDGKMGGHAAGIVGLRPRRGSDGKIFNTRWSPRYERLGWTGSHTDATSEPFVRYELARHILSPHTDAATAAHQVATRPAPPATAPAGE